MKRLDVNTVPKNLKKNPIFKTLPKELKDPVRYKEVETKIQRIMFSDHTHKNVTGFVKCERCSAKLKKKQQALKDFGFTHYSQYLEWRRIMDIIVNQKDLQLS